MSALASAASFSEDCSTVATEIFSRNFASDAIRFVNAELASFDILKHFGHLISKISLHFHRDNNVEVCTSNDAIKYANLLQLVNLYSQNSLVEFEILYESDCIVDIFAEIKGPFELAETVSIQLKNTTIKTDNLRLCPIFPSVHQLDLNIESVTDPKFVDCEYDSLDGLKLAGRLLDKTMEKKFKGLIKHNQHIRWLSLTSPNYRVLRFVNRHLPNLEEFHILHSIKKDVLILQEKVFFQRIKKLNLQFAARECNPPKWISFNRGLEELTFHCAHSDIDENYFKILLTYPRVKKLTAGAEFNNRQLSKLIGKFPVLSEAQFSFRVDVNTDTIYQFVRKSKRLNVLRFLFMANGNATEFATQLETNVREFFKVRFNVLEASTEFVVERIIPISIATKLLTSSAFILFIVLHIINRVLFI